VEEQRHLRVGVNGISKLQGLTNGSEGSRMAQLVGPKRLGARRGDDTELPGGKDAKLPGGTPISSPSSAFLLPLLLSFPLNSLSSFGYLWRLGMAKRRWRQWVL
jgi:hypothetical protein